MATSALCQPARRRVDQPGSTHKLPVHPAHSSSDSNLCRARPGVCPLAYSAPIWDLRPKDARLDAFPGSNYLDNLELVDETLIQLRQALETSGLWDTTSILITSDHPFRRELWKDFSSQNIVRLLETVDNSQVPFILKLAGQRLPTVYGKAFNLVLVHDLSLALLRREVSTATEFVRWMDRNRQRFPS